MQTPNTTQNHIAVTIELGPKSMEKLDQILEALRRHNCHSCVESVTHYVAACLGHAPGKTHADDAVRLGAAEAPVELNTGHDAGGHGNTHPVDDAATWGAVEAPVEPDTGHAAGGHEDTHPVDDAPPWGDAEPSQGSTPEGAEYTKQDVQAMVQKLAAPSSPKRAEVRALVKSYASRVSEIPESKYPELMAKLAALDKE